MTRSKMSKAKAITLLANAREVQSEVDLQLGPLPDGTPSGISPVLPTSRFGKRPYLLQVVRQINVTYSSACYDACAVLIRRLIETLLIEAYEAKQIQGQIIDANGNFKGLDDIIKDAVGPNGLTLSRNAKRELVPLKELGDRSAHNRRFVAHRSDIDAIRSPLRTVTDELLNEAGLR